VALRKKGLSYKEITACTGVGKSSIHYMVKGIALTAKQQARLKNKMVESGHKLAVLVKSDPKLRQLMSAKAKEVWQALTQDAKARRLANLGNPCSAGLVYRKDELPVKVVLEKLFGCTFKKECIDGRYFDFASADYLIEYTTDTTHGLTDVVRRFEQAARVDPRRKIAYVNFKQLGPRRRARLVAAGVEIRNFRSLGH
jgi:predicted RNA-binding protein (virulence factor B family)